MACIGGPDATAFRPAIALQHVVNVGEADGPGAIGRPVAVAEDHRGRLYVVSEESSYRIVVFDSLGLHLRTLGIDGAGPGEFRSIVALHIGRGDTLRVFDGRNARITILDPEGRLAGTIPFVGYVTATAELADGQTVVAGLIGQDTSSASLHLLDRSGAVKASFGDEYLQRDHRTFYTSRRVVAPAADGGVWAATPLTYRIQRWSSGQLDHTVERDDEWFPARETPGRVTPEHPPDPEIRAIQEGRDGLLRVLVTVGEAGWADGLGERAVRTPEGDFHPVEDVDRVFGTRIEVIDPVSSSTVASLTSEEWLFAFLRPDRAVSYRESPFPRLSVWEIVLHLEGSEGAPPRSQSLIELRLAHSEPAPHLERVELDGDTLYLERGEVVSDADLLSVRPSLRDDGLLLDMHVSPEGARRLRDRTGENVGKRLALLVDGRVRSAAVIRSAIGPRIQVVIDMAADEAERIAERIRQRWRDELGVEYMPSTHSIARNGRG